MHRELDGPLVSWLLLFQTRRLRVLSSWSSTIFSSCDTSMLWCKASSSPSNPTMKSKKGSIVVFEAGEEGVTRRTCSALDGGWA